MNKLYSLYDNVAEQYGPIFMLKNDSLAIRNVEVFYEQNEEKDKHFHRSDFCLYCLGTFDIETGVISFDLKKVSNWSVEGEEND